MKRRIILIALLLIVCSVLLTGCRLSEEIPSLEVVEHDLLANYEDIKVILEYMITSDYDSIHIAEYMEGINYNYKNYDGTIWADFNMEKIESKKVIKSLKKILSEGVFIRISKNGNTIDFMYWSAFVRDISCGVAYSINGEDKPEIQYETQIVPLGKDGWYYYVEDYEQWRVNKKKTD